MKNKFIYSLIAAFTMMFSLTGCEDKEEIIFDHEYPQFETRTDAILLEVIMPSSTSVDDVIYIAGAFNGGEEVAKGNPMWQLEKAQGNDVKWGIYLNPSDFVEGTTLADGFYFVNKEQGVERTLFNEDVVRTDNPAVGTRNNITVDRWKSYFDKPQNPDEIVHDGYVIYVIDNTGYDELAMYAWGDAEAFGGWPGMLPTGKVEIEGKTYKYFDTTEANAGLNLNLIFNNNGAGQQLGDYNITLDRDYYLELTADGVVEMGKEDMIEHDGHAVFVVNKTGWTDEELHLYMWGDVNDLNGAWPGVAATGSITINNVNYLYFDMGEANTGLNENLIFNNNNGSQLSDFAYTIDHDVYLELTTVVTEIDPETYVPGGSTPTPEPEPDVPTTVKHKIYIEDLTGWSAFAIYAWGDSEPFGGWPGVTSEGLSTYVRGGHTFLVYEVDATETVRNFIFNDTAGTQFDGPAIVIDRDYYFSVTSSSFTELNPAEFAKSARIYVDDQTGWSSLYLYAWGEKEYFGGWPGAAPSGTETIDGVTYKYWDHTGEGEDENLIFNNGNGTQLGDFNIKLYGDIYLTITPDGCSAK